MGVEFKREGDLIKFNYGWSHSRIPRTKPIKSKSLSGLLGIYWYVKCSGLSLPQTIKFVFSKLGKLSTCSSWCGGLDQKQLSGIEEDKPILFWQTFSEYIVSRF